MNVTVFFKKAYYFKEHSFINRDSLKSYIRVQLDVLQNQVNRKEVNIYDITSIYVWYK